MASYETDRIKLLAACGELEGLVAKRCAAAYRSGAHSRDWIVSVPAHGARSCPPEA